MYIYRRIDSIVKVIAKAVSCGGHSGALYLSFEVIFQYHYCDKWRASHSLIELQCKVPCIFIRQT